MFANYLYFCVILSFLWNIKLRKDNYYCEAGHAHRSVAFDIILGGGGGYIFLCGFVFVFCFWFFFCLFFFFDKSFFPNFSFKCFFVYIFLLVLFPPVSFYIWRSLKYWEFPLIPMFGCFGIFHFYILNELSIVTLPVNRRGQWSIQYIIWYS